MDKKINFNFMKLFIFTAKISVVTLTVYLYSYFTGNPSEALLDKTLSILNQTIQEVYLRRLCSKNLRGIDDDPR